MKDYRVTVKVRNNRILRKIESLFPNLSIPKFCEQTNVSYSSLHKLINLLDSPILRTGELSACAQSLCDALRCIPDDLWSQEQLYPLEKNFSDIEMNYEQILAITGSNELLEEDCFAEIENKESENLFKTALTCLTAREERVVRMRFYESLTLDQIGNELGICRERIREIEAKALRKMRHPNISSKLSACL